MPYRLCIFTRKKRSESPEELVDRTIRDLKRRITESRIQVLAVELAKVRVKSGAESAAEIETSYAMTCQALERLESTLHELQSKRDLLIARTRDAEARVAIERALMDVDKNPAEVALELLSDKVCDTEAEADAVEEVRQVINEVRGPGDV